MTETTEIEAFKQKMKQRINTLEEQIEAQADSDNLAPDIQDLRDELAELRKEYEAMKFKEENDQFDYYRNRFTEEYDNLHTRFLAARDNTISH